eukprot:10005099-Alexandrium_andersonii.AAC.1
MRLSGDALATKWPPCTSLQSAAASCTRARAVLGSVGSVSVVLGSIDRFGSIDIPLRLSLIHI